MPAHSAAAAAGLLVLLGVVLASSHPVQYLSDDFVGRVDSLKTKLGLTKPNIGGSPLFAEVIRSINSSCQQRDDMQLMNATLNVYRRVFSSILEQEQEPSSLLAHQGVKDVVLYLQEKMETLQKHLSHASHHRERLLSSLNRIQ
uniref:Uncharacterized protein n=2 Tax=Salarias fasciatus TaxID=181472 RepID=A0A672F383_SALFA